MKEYRHRQILAILEQRPAVYAQELATMLQASVSTIRRDLQELQIAGQLRRVHGGAFAEMDGETEFGLRLCAHRQAKQAICWAVAEHIHSGMVLFIDGGTTTELLIPLLVNKVDLTIVTCGLNIALHLTRYPYLNTILLGGEVHAKSRTVVGMLPTSQLESFNMRFDVSLISTAGISAEHGATNRMIERLALKKKAIANSTHSYLLCDSSKVGCTYLGQVAPLSQFRACFVDEAVPPEHKKSLQKAGNMIFVPLAETP